MDQQINTSLCICIVLYSVYTINQLRLQSYISLSENMNPVGLNFHVDMHTVELLRFI